MPKPRDDESKEEFMNRCIPILIDEGKERDQAIAVCSSLYDNKDKSGEAKMDNKYFNIVVKASEKEERTLEGIATSQIADRDGDVVMVEGIDLKNFKKNPVILWAHNYSEPPIGKATKIWKEDKDLKFKMKFVEPETYPFAETIYKLFAGGYINSFSMGFRPDVKEAQFDEKNGGFIFNKCELIEISAVPLPSNTAAVAVTVKSIEKAYNEKVINKDEFDLLNNTIQNIVEEMAVIKGDIEEEADREELEKELDYIEDMKLINEITDINIKLDKLISLLEIKSQERNSSGIVPEQNTIESYIDKIFMEIQEDRSTETQDHSTESSFEDYCKDVINGLQK